MIKMLDSIGGTSGFVLSLSLTIPLGACVPGEEDGEGESTGADEGTDESGGSDTSSDSGSDSRESSESDSSGESDSESTESTESESTESTESESTESTESESTESTESTESESESTESSEEDTGGTTGAFDGQPCDPYAQDCPRGHKCSVYLVNGDWQPPLENVCASILAPGTGQHLEPCEIDYGSPDDIIHDDCAPGLFCSDYDPLSGVGTCRPFCNLENPSCPPGLVCHASPEVLPICRTPCNPDGGNNQCGEYEYCANIGGGQGVCANVPAP